MGCVGGHSILMSQHWHLQGRAVYQEFKFPRVKFCAARCLVFFVIYGAELVLSLCSIVCRYCTILACRARCVFFFSELLEPVS
jgi:hypothetical protein